MRPFTLRWDDAEPTVIDLSFLSPGEAGADGPVHVNADGYLATNSGRLKLFGQNTGGGTVFADGVTDEQRDAFAARLRKFGFNAMRFHHLGATWFPRNAFGIVENDRNASTTEIDPESLDRLHRWVAAMRRHGIYTNMNLLVSRRFVPADGLPEIIDDVPWKLQGTIAIWHPRLIELQKEYARQLLASDNPHTGVPLAADPSLATVEINNENGLLHTWLSGDLDDVPAELAKPLRERWNEWLAAKYAGDAEVAAAWDARDVPLGEPMLEGDDGFALEAQGGAAAALKTNVRDGTRRVVVSEPGTEGWHVQYLRPGLTFEAGTPYTLTFTASADSPRTIGVDARQAQEPWGNLGFDATVEVGPEPRALTFVFVPTVSEADGRVSFGGLSQAGASFVFRDVTLRPGGKIGGVTTLGEVPIPTQSDTMTLPQRRDWFAFCMDVEKDYFGDMRDFLQRDVGVTCPVVGTIVGCSPMGVQKEMDAIDTHAYWRHPQFPGGDWDEEVWTVQPDSMVNFPKSSAILGPMLKQVRVDGRRKPHMLTEYDHPAPNPHAGEGPLFLAAYAALQDFDAVYLFAYDKSDFADDGGKIEGFFDYVNHPTKMANCIPAALMFRRGDVEPAEAEAVVGITEAMDSNALVERGAAWGMVDFGRLHRRAALPPTSRQVAVDFADASYNPAPEVFRCCNEHCLNQATSSKSTHGSPLQHLEWRHTGTTSALFTVFAARTGSAAELRRRIGRGGSRGRPGGAIEQSRNASTASQVPGGQR